MYKKSFFRGLGTGLIVGALTVTVAFNFDNAGKSDSGQGSSVGVVQQNSTEDSEAATSETSEKATTEKATTEKSTTEKGKTDKSNTDKKSTDKSGIENTEAGSKSDGTGVNSKGDVYAGADSSDGKNTSDSSGSGSGSNGSAGDKTGGTGTADNKGDLSDKTEKVPSAKDNGYTEDKNSQSGSGSSAGKTTEATTESVQPSAIKYDNGGGEITFGSGTSAYEICQLLAQIGIRDADEYYDWLLRSGYSGSLVPGTYTFTGNETNGGIVWILLGNQ